jgi:hypothetical protein
MAVEINPKTSHVSFAGSDVKAGANAVKVALYGGDAQRRKKE